MPSAADRAGRSQRDHRRSELTGGDRIVRAVLLAAGALPALALLYLVVYLLKEAYPAIVFNGSHFLTSSTFDIGSQYGTTFEVRHGYRALQHASFGIDLILFGTVASSLIALVFAVPISIGGAVLLVERVPARVENVIGVFLELLAGIPSVVFGLWGYFTFGPFLAHYVFPAVSALHIPWLHGKVPVPFEGLATASLVLAAMIIPIIAATVRELVRSVPQVSREGATALGLTASESVRAVTFPFISGGIVAASILGLARALGETIAVLIISGFNLSSFPRTVYDPFATMSGTVADVLDSALTDGTGMALHALAEVSLVLLVITLLANFGGRLIAQRFGGVSLPVGRGV